MNLQSMSDAEARIYWKKSLNITRTHKNKSRKIFFSAMVMLQQI